MGAVLCKEGKEGTDIAALPTMLLSSPSANDGGSSPSFGGTLIGGRYRVVREVASGTFGRVVLGECLRTQERVAIKLLTPHLQNDTLVRNYFFAEADHLQTLSHPHVVRGLGAGIEDDGTAYHVMEHIEGRTLRSLIAEHGTLSPTQSIEIAVQIASALEHCHARGIVHRDLKPENVMISFDGSVKVIDFGVARRSSSEDDLLAVVGTVFYMAPEQMVGERADERADIFALGCLLREMITGERHGAFPEPESSVAWLCETMSAHAREERPPTMTEVRRALLQISAGRDGARVSVVVKSGESPVRRTRAQRVQLAPLKKEQRVHGTCVTTEIPPWLLRVVVRSTLAPEPTHTKNRLLNSPILAIANGGDSSD